MLAMRSATNCVGGLAAAVALTMDKMDIMSSNSTKNVLDCDKIMSTFKKVLFKLTLFFFGYLNFF